MQDISFYIFNRWQPGETLSRKSDFFGKGSGTNSAKHPKGRSGYWCLTPFPRPKRSIDRA